MRNGRRRPVTCAAMFVCAASVAGCSDSSDPVDPATPAHTLTVAVTGTGGGQVTSQPPGIDCGPSAGDCAFAFDEGTVVTLTASPDAGSTFTGWSGAGTGTDQRTVTMDEPSSVTAAFDDPNTTVVEIGTAGGIVESTDGRVTLEIPAGALTGATPISIRTADAGALGPEFDALPAALDIRGVYELGPTGTVFEQPVTVRLLSDSVAGDPTGDLALPLRVLLVSDGTAVASLQDQRLEADSATGGVLVAGDLTHFSALVDVAPIGAAKVEFSVEGVPAELPRGESFIAHASIQGAAEGDVTVIAPARYTDRSSAPVEPQFSPLTADLEDGGPGRFEGAFGYACAEVGSDLYGTDMAVGVRIVLGADVIVAETFARLRKLVVCTQPEVDPPTVTQVVVADTDGSNQVRQSAGEVNIEVEGTNLDIVTAVQFGNEFGVFTADVLSFTSETFNIGVRFDIPPGPLEMAATYCAAPSGDGGCDEEATIVVPDAIEITPITVEVDGDDETGHGTPDHPYGTVGYGILGSSPGDWIVIGAGEFDLDVPMLDISGRKVAGASESLTTIRGTWSDPPDAAFFAGVPDGYDCETDCGASIADMTLASMNLMAFRVEAAWPGEAAGEPTAVFKDVRIEAPAVGIEASDGAIAESDGLTVVDASEAGIRAWGLGTEWRIGGAMISDIAGIGLDVSDGARVEVRDSWIIDNDYGMRVRNADAAISGSWFTGNGYGFMAIGDEAEWEIDITDSHFQGNVYAAGVIGSWSDVSIDRTEFRSNYGNGFDWNAVSPRLGITYSVFDSNDGHGLRLMPRTNVAVFRENSFQNNAGDGVHIEPVEMPGMLDFGIMGEPGGNIFSGNGGFQFFDGRGPVDDMIGLRGNDWPPGIPEPIGEHTGPTSYSTGGIDVFAIEGSGNRIAFGGPQMVLMEFDTESVSGLHRVGQHACPNTLDVIRLTNPSAETIDWSAATMVALDPSPAAGTLGPGEHVDVTVSFNCAVLESFEATISFIAVTLPGYAMDVSQVGVSVEVEELAVLLEHDLDAELGFVVGAYIFLSRITNGAPSGSDVGCQPDGDQDGSHLHAPPPGITIDGVHGPFEDPNAGGCGYGRLYWLKR